MLRNIGSLVALILLLTLAGPQRALAGPTEETVYAAFEFACLGFMNDYSRLPPLLDNVGKEMSADESKRVTQPHVGRTWRIKNDGAHFVVSLVDTGVCSLISPDADGEGVKEIFLKYVKNKPLAKTPEGSQDLDWYSVEFQDAHDGDPAYGVVMVTTSKLESVSGIILNAMPEAILTKEMGRRPPRP